jgi:benzylsuccinate CoA-transferase BbsF subunit
MHPLSGITVVECGVAIAGPLATRYLAHLGAEVIKVETRTAGSNLAGGGPSWAPKDLGPAAADLSLARNTFESQKRSVGIDLKTADGRRIISELLARSDVFLTNFSIPAIESLRLRYDDVRAWNESIIYVSMPGFGESPGPYREYRSWGPNLSALSGIDWLTGDPDRPPVLAPSPLPDYGGAYHALVAILKALTDKRRTGRGSRIELSQFETTVTVLGPQFLEQQLGGDAPIRSGNRVQGAAPRGVFPCRGEDRWLAIEIRSDAEWQALCSLRDVPPELRDERLRTYEGRVTAQDSIEEAIACWTRGQTNREAALRLQRAGVAAAALQDGWDQVTDPHLEARDTWRLVGHDRLGTDLIMGLPLKLSATPLRYEHAGPSFGHDTHDVLETRLGLSPTEAERIEAGRAVQSEAAIPASLGDVKLERPSRAVAWPLLRVLDHLPHETPQPPAPVSEPIPADITRCRVLDLSDALSANGTRLLALLGAEVIRIDSPALAGRSRRAPFHEGQSLYQAYMDAGKKSLACDLDSPAGRAAFEELARTADIVYESTPPGWLDARGLGWERLHALNPNLILVSVTPFGQTGPYRDWQADELCLWALSGLLRLTGYPDRRPITPGAWLGSSFIGAVGAVGVLSALYARGTIGTGQWVDVSGHEVLATTAGSALGQLEDGAARKRSGVHALGSAPWGYFQCHDRPICLLALFPDHWNSLAAWIAEKTGDQEALDARFQGSSQRRYAHLNDVERLINSLTALYPADEFCREAQARGVPAAPVNSASDVLRDPHLAAVGFWRDAELPGLGRVRLPGPPFRLSDVAGVASLPVT